MHKTFRAQNLYCYHIDPKINPSIVIKLETIKYKDERGSFSWHYQFPTPVQWWHDQMQLIYEATLQDLHLHAPSNGI
jgi:hypothetical protein